jgi:hypothetical protein
MYGSNCLRTMLIEERLQANDNALRAILGLRHAHRLRLPVLEETLRQLGEKFGSGRGKYKKNGDNQ